MREIAEQHRLRQATELTGRADTAVHYDRWAENYDRGLTAAGYAAPGRSAAALAQFVGSKNAALLDLGCGTGCRARHSSPPALRIRDGGPYLPSEDIGAEVYVLRRR